MARLPEMNVVEFPEDERERRRILHEHENKRLRQIGVLRRATGWLLVIALFLFFLFNYRLLSPASLRNIVGYATAGLQHTGDASAIAFENGSFADAALFGSGLAYSDGDMLYLARAGGAITYSSQLSYNDVAVESAGDYVLAYDRGGHTATLCNSIASVAAVETTSPILTGTAAPSGDFALLTDEQGYRTALTVYNGGGDEVFRFASSEYYMTAAALADNGKSVTVLGLLQNGETLETHVLYFNTNQGDVQSDIVLPDTLGMQLVPLSGSTVAVLGDNGLYTVSPRGTVEEALSYAANDLIAFSCTPNALALAVRSYSGEARADLYLLRANGRMSDLLPLSEAPSALALSDAGVAVLSAAGVSFYNSALSPQWHNAEGVGARRILLSDEGTVFALYSKNARLFTASSAGSEGIS